MIFGYFTTLSLANTSPHIFNLNAQFTFVLFNYSRILTLSSERIDAAFVLQVDQNQPLPPFLSCNVLGYSR